MQQSTENRQIVDADENRQPHIKEIGPHEHAWAFVGMGADGGRYEVCEFCGTRRVANIPLLVAAHRDWIEGKEGAKFEPEKEFEAQQQGRQKVETSAEADELEKDYKAKRERDFQAQSGQPVVPVVEVDEKGKPKSGSHKS